MSPLYFICCPNVFQDEKEQLAEFKAHLDGLMRRAKTIVQLKPRNPATAIKGKQPIQAVCDFKQMEVRGSAFSVCPLLQRQPDCSCFMPSWKPAGAPADHCAPRGRVRPAEQLAALQVEGAER